MYFQYTGDLKFNIMGQEFKCPSIFGMFNCKLADVKVADGTTTLFFADESDDKTGYTSVLSFATEKELDAYGHVEKYNHANDLKDAQTIQQIFFVAVHLVLFFFGQALALDAGFVGGIVIGQT